jgi:hypothetical protein
MKSGGFSNESSKYLIKQFIVALRYRNVLPYYTAILKVGGNADN